MLLRLDHLVVACTDPDAAAADLEEIVGLRCTGGGRHPLWGTHNRLAWLGDTYVELIGVFDPSLTSNGAVSRTVAAALEAGHVGLVSYAIATDDADIDVAALHDGGSELGDIEARSRTRPDGDVVRWRAAFPPALGPAEPPFLVEHEPVGAEWGDAARAERAGLVHPAGGTARVSALELPVVDVGKAARAYERTIGLVFDEVDPRLAVAGIGEQEIRLHHGAPYWNPAIVEVVVAGLDESVERSIEAVGVRWRIVGVPT